MCGVFEIACKILLAFSTARHEFRGLSRLVGNVGKLMADQATGSKDEKRRGERGCIGPDPRLVRRSYIFRPRGRRKQK